MKLIRTALAVSVVLLAVTAAAAQTGGIKIVVLDEEGLPLPGATVTISNETGYVKTTSELSNAKGLVQFPVLRPGSGYSIQVSFPGTSPIRYDDIHVKLSETLPLTIQMMGEFQETVKVIADAEVIDLDKSESSTRFTDDFISDLPVPGRFYQNVLTMAPGVQDADGDGNPNVHGSRSRDFQAVVGGVSNVDPLTGQWLSRINTNSIEEMEVITAGAGVEFGRAQGGFARIIQKQGSNTHEGVVELYWRTSKLDGDGAEDNSDLPETKFESLQPSFQFSGPLKKDKLWYRASYERIDDEQPVNVLSGIEVFERLRETFDGQVTWQVSPRNKLAFQFRSDPDEASNFGISSRVGPESAQVFDRDVETWTLNWTAPYSPKVLVETTMAWQDINNSSGPTNEGLLNDCVPNADEGFLNAAYCSDSTRNIVSGSWFRTNDDHRQRFTLKGQATVYGGRFWGMTHQFKMGINVENERFFRDLQERPFINYQEITFGSEDETNPDDEPTLESFGLVISRIAVPQTDDVRATGTNWALYGEDQFKPAQNLTITLGGRIDREEINSEGRQPFDPQAELAAYTEHVENFPIGGPDDWPEFFTGYENIESFEGQLVDILCAEGEDGQDVDASCAIKVQEQVLSQDTDALELKRKGTNIHIQNTNLSPFLSVAWSPWANGKTAFKASVGRYYNNIPLVVPLAELEPVRTTVEYRASLVDPENCPEPDPDDPNPPAVACGKTDVVGGISPLLTILTVDRNLNTPYQDEFTFKVERELWAETSMSVTYISRSFKDQIQDINLNVATGDLGSCKKQTSAVLEPIVQSPGQSLGVCSTSLNTCAGDSDCAGGESCGYDYYFIDPVAFCNITADCKDNNFNYPSHACNLGVDPFCGVPYPDMNPGNGDGFVDPLTGFVDTDGDGFADDNCVGDTFVQTDDSTACDPVTDPFCQNAEILQRPDDVTDLYLQNPFWGDIFLIGNFNEIDYEAYVLELVRRQYRSWEMNASYTWSEARGDGEDFFQALGDDPTLRDATFGFQSYDQTHVVKVNATTITPWGVRLGSSVTWQSGLPYSLLIEDFSFDTQAPVTTSFGGEGARPRQTYTTGLRNDQRNEAFWNVDLKATKELRLGKGMNLQVSAEVFNLLDDGTYQVFNPDLERGVQINGINEARPRFGRRWQIGMKLAF